MVLVYFSSRLKFVFRYDRTVLISTTEPANAIFHFAELEEAFNSQTDKYFEYHGPCETKELIKDTVYSVCNQKAVFSVNALEVKALRLELIPILYAFDLVFEAIDDKLPNRAFAQNEFLRRFSLHWRKLKAEKVLVAINSIPANYKEKTAFYVKMLCTHVYDFNTTVFEIERKAECVIFFEPKFCTPGT